MLPVIVSFGLKTPANLSNIVRVRPINLQRLVARRNEGANARKLQHTLLSRMHQGLHSTFRPPRRVQYNYCYIRVSENRREKERKK